MTVTYEDVIDAMSDLRYEGHEPSVLLVGDGEIETLMADGGEEIDDDLSLDAGSEEEPHTEEDVEEFLEEDIDGIVDEDDDQDDVDDTVSSETGEKVGEIEAFDVVEATGPLPGGEAAVLFGENYEGRIIIE